MKTIKLLLFIAIVGFMAENASAQSTTLGNFRPGFAAYLGWSGLGPNPGSLEVRNNFAGQPINFFTGGVQRATILGSGGPTAGFVGIGNGFVNPVSLLHLHQPAGNNVFLRFSNAGTGATNLDGFVVGMLNGTVNGDACLIQYEPNPIRFFISDVNVAGPAPERMQLTYGGQMAGGTAAYAKQSVTGTI